MLEINNISKSYRKGPEVYNALVNVTLGIKKGEFIVISGSSGAGKSTLLNIIGGLTQPDSGEVLFNNSDIYKQEHSKTDQYRKKHVGFMFQQFHLMPYLTVEENIQLACREKEHFDSIGYYLEKCLLPELKNKYSSELSVGEKQRAAFIRAIISNPDILLADEPTGNLDPANSNMLMSLVEDYHKNGGTVLIVSHDQLASEYATRSITMDRGRVG